jgi:protocatechuate 3,4-dioxygenase beta subunit
VRKAIAVGLVVVLAIVLVAWKACGSSSKPKSAAHGGSGTTGSSFVSSRLNKTGPVEPASIAGRVTRAQDGAPVPGATVSLAPAELMAMFIKSDMPTLVAITDANGNWKADRVMPGAYVAAATARGYLPSSHDKITVQQGEARTGIDIALTQGGTIVSGTVSDFGGGGIGDARITANKGSEIPDLSGHAEYVVTTKPDGTYEITLPNGEFRLEAAHDDYTSAGHRIEVAGTPLTQDFQLIPGAVVRGTVVAKDTGKPVPGALVRAEGGERGTRGGDSGGTTIADADGNFTIRSLGSGTLQLNALGRGYASPQAGTSVSVGIGEQVDGVRVLVERAYSISGRVVQKGKPDKGVPGITLGAFSIAAKAFGLAIEPSGPDGSFEIYGVKPATYMLFAVGEGTVPEIGKNVEVVDKDVTDVIVEMSTGVTVSGVVSPPLPGAVITVEMEGEFNMARMFDMAKLVLIRGETDNAGAFTLKNVPPGAFKLNAGAPDGHTGETPVVIGEQDKAGVVIKLEPRASVSGRVTDSNGKPVAGGKVYVDDLDPDKDKKVNFSFNDMRNRNSATTGPDGTYKVVGLEAGKVRVRANDGIGEDFYFMAKKDQPAKSAVEVTLVAAQNTPNVNLQVEARDGAIRGTVLMPDGKPAKDAWVTAHRARDKSPDDKESRFEGWLGPGQPPVLTDDAGAFTINKLRKGSYNLMVDGPKGTSHAEQNGVKTGESVTIKLLALGTLTGTVTLAGAPVPSYDIECRGPHFDNSERHIDSKDGTYELERLTPGAYTCSVDSPTASGSGKIDVPAGEAKLDITLTRFASVTGTVVSVLDKKPIAGVVVFAGNDANMNSATFSQMLQGTAPKTDASGKFKVDRVPTGKGKVAVMPKDGFMPLGTKDYTVASEGQVVDVGLIEVVPPREGDAGTFGMSTAPTISTVTTFGEGSGTGSSSTSEKLTVGSVKEGGPAQLAGVKEGDLITKINGQDVSKLGGMTASKLLESGSVGVGVTVTLSIERAGQPVQATMTSIKW